MNFRDLNPSSFMLQKCFSLARLLQDARVTWMRKKMPATVETSGIKTKKQRKLLKLVENYRNNFIDHSSSVKYQLPLYLVCESLYIINQNDIFYLLFYCRKCRFIGNGVAIVKQILSICSTKHGNISLSSNHCSISLFSFSVQSLFFVFSVNVPRTLQCPFEKFIREFKCLFSLACFCFYVETKEIRFPSAIPLQLQFFKKNYQVMRGTTRIFVERS